MARALAVLGQIQAPHALRRALVREKLRQVTLAWAFLAGGLTLQLALPQAHVPALAGAALVSAAACLGMLRSLSRARLLPIPFAQLLDAAPFLICAALILLDLNRLLERVGSLPMTVLALCALAFPCLALRLARRWGHSLPLYRWAERAPSRGLAAWVSMQARRYTMLTSHQDRDAPFPAASKASILAMPFLVMAGRPLWEAGTINLFQCLMLTVVVASSSGALIVRDLHWRSLLMPAGLRRGSIGWHIVASTLTLQYGVMLLLAAVYGIGAHFGAGVSWDRIGQDLLRASTLPLELLLVTSAAVVVSAAPKLSWAGASLLLFALGAGFAALIWKSMNFPVTLTVPLPVFVLTLLGASALLVGLANRIWTINRLFATARRRPA